MLTVCIKKVVTAPRYEFVCVYKRLCMAEQSHKGGIFKLFNKNSFSDLFKKFLIFILLHIVNTENRTRNQLFSFIYFFYFFAWEIYYSITLYLNYKSCENVISLVCKTFVDSHPIFIQHNEKYKQIKTPGEYSNLHEIKMGLAFDFAFHHKHKCLYVLSLMYFETIFSYVLILNSSTMNLSRYNNHLKHSLHSIKLIEFLNI